MSLEIIKPFNSVSVSCIGGCVNLGNKFFLASFEKIEKLVKESFKISSIAFAIFLLLSNAGPASFPVLFMAPVFEEIAFRGFIQTGLEYTQHGYNRIKQVCFKTETSQADLEAQKKTRVWITAILFGLAHLGNQHASLIAKVMHVSFCCFGGLAYGFLKEKTETVAFGIFFHFSHNFIAVYTSPFFNTVIEPIVIEAGRIMAVLFNGHKNVAVDLACRLADVVFRVSSLAALCLLDYSLYVYSTQEATTECS